MENEDNKGSEGGEETTRPADDQDATSQGGGCINVDMLPCKLTFFCNSAALSSVFPFLNLFYVSSGLTPARAGLCNAIENVFSMFAVPLWGAFIDRTKHHKLLLGKLKDVVNKFSIDIAQQKYH